MSPVGIIQLDHWHTFTHLYTSIGTFKFSPSDQPKIASYRPKTRQVQCSKGKEQNF